MSPAPVCPSIFSNRDQWILIDLADTGNECLEDFVFIVVEDRQDDDDNDEHEDDEDHEADVAADDPIVEDDVMSSPLPAPGSRHNLPLDICPGQNRLLQ